MINILYLDNDCTRHRATLDLLREVDDRISIHPFTTITRTEFQAEKFTVLLIHHSNPEKGDIRKTWWSEDQAEAHLVLFSAGFDTIDYLKTNITYLPQDKLVHFVEEFVERS